MDDIVLVALANKWTPSVYLHHYHYYYQLKVSEDLTSHKEKVATTPMASAQKGRGDMKMTISLVFSFGVLHSNKGLKTSKYLVNIQGLFHLCMALFN